MKRRSNFRVAAVALALCILCTVPAIAQNAPPAQPGLDAELFPPDLVMRFQKEIDLTQEQSRAILDVTQTTQKQMLEIQWELQPELQALRDALSETRVDEGEVRSRLAKITSTEARAKELQLMLMVRVKNLLAADQQARLAELR